jgi:hypothetical protein
MKKMKRIIFIALAIPIVIGITIFSCKAAKEEPKDYMIFEGKIDNHDTNIKYMRIYSTRLPVYATRDDEFNGNFGDSYEIPINEDGSFSVTLKFKKSGYFNLKYNLSTVIYLNRTHDLKLSVINTFNTSVQEDMQKYNIWHYLKIDKFKGKDAIINTYLQVQEKAEIKLTDSKKLKTDKTDKLSDKEFIAKTKDRKIESERILKESGIKDNSFLKIESKIIYYKYLSSLVWSHYNKKDVLENFDPNDLIAYENSRNYHQLIQTFCTYAITERFPLPDRPLTDEEKSFNYWLKQYFLILNEKVTNEAIKNHIIYGQEWRSLMMTKKKIDEECYKSAMTYLTDKHFKEDLERVHKEKRLMLLGLAKGRISPKFKNYENYKGGTVSLDDFKGKYVFINAWAPC